MDMKEVMLRREDVVNLVERVDRNWKRCGVR
jgi:hypothetical protein